MPAQPVFTPCPVTPPPRKRRAGATADARDFPIAAESRPSGAASAPLDVLVRVFEFLPRAQLADSVTHVSRSWHAAAETRALWRDEQLFDDDGTLNTRCVRARVVKTSTARGTLRGTSRADGSPLLLRFFPVPAGEAISDLPASYVRIHCLANTPALREARGVAPVAGVGRLDPDVAVVAERHRCGTLCGALRHERARNLGPPDPAAVRALCEGVMSGLAAFHGLGLLHGRVHPHSVLLTHTRGLKPGASRPVQACLRICSTGVSTAAAVRPARRSAPPLPYQAPEALLGDPALAPAEVWAAACVVAEAVLGQPLVEASSGVEALFGIFRLTGSPSVGMWRSLGRYRYATGAPGTLGRGDFPRWRRGGLSRLLRARLSLSPHWRAADVDAAVDWLTHALVLDPDRRPTAAACLNHPFLGRRPAVSAYPAVSRLPCALPGWSVSAHIAQRRALHDMAQARLALARSAGRVRATPNKRRLCLDSPSADVADGEDRFILGLWLRNSAHRLNVHPSDMCAGMSLLDRVWPTAATDLPVQSRTDGLVTMAVLADVRGRPLCARDLKELVLRAWTMPEGGEEELPVTSLYKNDVIRTMAPLIYSAPSAYDVALAAAALVGYSSPAVTWACRCCEAAIVTGAELPSGGPTCLAAAALLLGAAAARHRAVVWDSELGHTVPIDPAAALTAVTVAQDFLRKHTDDFPLYRREEEWQRTLARLPVDEQSFRDAAAAP